MAGSENPSRDRRTISCPVVPDVAQLVDVSTASSRDAPPAYNSSTHSQASPTRSPVHESHDSAAQSPTSPAARTFFSAIKQQVRSRSRSLSCSRGPSPSPSRSNWQDAGTSAGDPNGESEDILGSPLMRTASPTVMTPQLSAGPSPASPVLNRDRHSNSLPVRPSARGENRSGSGSGSGNGNGSGTFTQCGRHSNEWLFNGYSVTGTVRGILERRRS